MAPAWQATLSTLDRFTIIQDLQASLPEDKRNEAIAIEEGAFHNSSSRDDYDATLRQAASHITSPVIASVRECIDTKPGITIGPYSDCKFVGEGVTSEVYRSASHALKVTTALRTIEPHNPQREAFILNELQAVQPSPNHIVELITTFHDQNSQFVLVFPFYPLTLETVLSQSASALPTSHLIPIFKGIFDALSFIHGHGIIHRDMKPSAVLLKSPSGPAYLSDFGTAWHPRLSTCAEPRSDKVLDIGTGPYRAPEVLFANKSYDAPVDIWAAGVMVAEAITNPPKPLFESRPASEDGNQLGLILSMIKTLGTPTEETWPEAKNFRVSPFDLWTIFPQRSWEEIMPDVDVSFRDLVAKLVCFESGKRLTAGQASKHDCLWKYD